MWPIFRRIVAIPLVRIQPPNTPLHLTAAGFSRLGGLCPPALW
jgi:hypothetical protein